MKRCIGSPLRLGFLASLVLSLAWASFSAMADTVRVKDLGKLRGWRDNALVGYGIVTGLAGTGDSPSNRTTRQTMANVLSQFNLSIAPEQVQSRNVAVVMVSAALPSFAREGDTLDITVTSAGDARSLLGGSLLLTPLKAPDGEVYALAQGPLSVGGYRHDANGNVVQKNHPTTGSVPNGAVVEVGVHANLLDARRNLTFVLSEPDYTTAERIAQAINTRMGRPLATARDASGIDIAVPPEFGEQLAGFMTRIEAVSVEPDRRAKVVVNERTGVVVSGGDVRISKVVISHGDIRIAIATQNTASQPYGLSRPGPEVRTAIVTNTQVLVQEGQEGQGSVVAASSTVAELIQALARLRTPTRDVISILRAVKAAGALHAELIVQ